MTAVTALVLCSRRLRRVCGRCRTPWPEGCEHHVCHDILRTQAFDASLKMARWLLDEDSQGNPELKRCDDALAGLPYLRAALMRAHMTAFAFAQLDPIDREAVVSILSHAGEQSLAEAVRLAA